MPFETPGGRLETFCGRILLEMSGSDLQRVGGTSAAFRDARRLVDEISPHPGSYLSKPAPAEVRPRLRQLVGAYVQDRRGYMTWVHDTLQAALDNHEGRETESRVVDDPARLCRIALRSVHPAERPSWTVPAILSIPMDDRPKSTTGRISL